MRQRAVALYFIDKLALRAGNEKDEDQADTVGCCSLRVEHITLHEEHDGNRPHGANSMKLLRVKSRIEFYKFSKSHSYEVFLAIFIEISFVK